MKAAVKIVVSESPAQQLAGFLDKFDPAVAKRIREARSALRKRLPTAFELVYDNYNFLAIGFGPTDRASDCTVSLAANGKGVSLCFIWGVNLPDPEKIMKGAGNQTRFVRLESVRTLSEPAVEALFRAAIDQSRAPFPTQGSGQTIIKSISAKQRPRR